MTSGRKLIDRKPFMEEPEGARELAAAAAEHRKRVMPSHHTAAERPLEPSVAFACVALILARAREALETRMEIVPCVNALRAIEQYAQDALPLMASSLSERDLEDARADVRETLERRKRKLERLRQIFGEE